ncbi:MFS transporter [Sulfitobacter mediterraneus]|uniref:EmrB/QacA subfamily drug resistance transporter n=1 Tax=Sulfitobacter mediterraneus TaxID=83219 RepID=A0A2T6CA93_9RHOB|nr:MFS transporter [Sulfitobacter mediterraneus]KIN78244.1 Albicidin efflux pump transmembrane protein [Sulfitobacter mediterraneus KCTC 32188]PTX72128.1 EmrB/QacA subfamily drug resistance transporter [Sulfitobacter mediterraneus]
MSAPQNTSNSVEPQFKPIRRWAALAVLYLASLINLIDVSIVNVALPQIQADTGATPTQLKWVAEAYVLALAVGLLPFGRFGDVFGRPRMFVWGLLGFTAASAVCGLAPNIESLIAARAMQGMAAAMMVPQVLAIVHVIFAPSEKARVFGLFGTISSLGVVVGPIIGGALISADLAGLGWRPAFLLNIPLGVAALVGAWLYLPRLETDRETQPDWFGSALFALAALLLIFPLIQGRALGWPWWSFALMAASIPAVLAFASHQRNRSARGASALMPPGLMSNPTYLYRLALVTLFFSGIPGLFLVLAIFLQAGFGLTALESGLVTTPFPVGVMVASMLTQRFGDRHLHARIAGGAALLVIGMLGLVIVIQSTGATPNGFAFAPPLLIAGFGMGAAVISLFQVTMASVAMQDAGAGSGAMQAFQQIGAALGIAVAGQIFFTVLGDGGMSAGSESAPRFVQAASCAVLYSVIVFFGLTFVVGWQALKSRKVTAGF